LITKDFFETRIAAGTSQPAKGVTDPRLIGGAEDSAAMADEAAGDMSERGTSDDVVRNQVLGYAQRVARI
jgi:hypothetical protein